MKKIHLKLVTAVLSGVIIAPSFTSCAKEDEGTQYILKRYKKIIYLI